MGKSCYNKDLIERSFKTLKSVLAVHPIRHWLDGKVKGHLFICYLSLVLLTTLGVLVLKQGKKAIKGITPERALKELMKIYIIEYSNASLMGKNEKVAKKTYYKVITLSNLQRDILSAISLDLEKS